MTSTFYNPIGAIEQHDTASDQVDGRDAHKSTEKLSHITDIFRGHLYIPILVGLPYSELFYFLASATGSLRNLFQIEEYWQIVPYVISNLLYHLEEIQALEQQ